MSSVFPPGLQLAARYRVLRLLEDNRIGALFEAESLATQQRVALKWLRFSSSRAPRQAEQHAEQARAASRLRQRSVARIHEVTHEGHAIFVVSDLLQGESLRSRLAPHAMALHERLHVLVDAMEAVIAAHHQGLVHGGLHPGNIFLHREHDEWAALPPVTKVLDFGISTHGLPESLAHPSERSELGPHVFLDYEQLAAASEPDPRSDVYAFGVLLYHALTGHVPYPAKTPFELGLKLGTTRATDPRALFPELPIELTELVSASVLRERAERPALAQLAAEARAYAAVRSSREVLAFGGPHTLRMIRQPAVLSVPSSDERPTLKIDLHDSARTTLRMDMLDFTTTQLELPRVMGAGVLASPSEPEARPTQQAPVSSMAEVTQAIALPSDDAMLSFRAGAASASKELSRVSVQPLRASERPTLELTSQPADAVMPQERASSASPHTAAAAPGGALVPRGYKRGWAVAALVLVALVALVRRLGPQAGHERVGLVLASPPALPSPPGARDERDETASELRSRGGVQAATVTIHDAPALLHASELEAGTRAHSARGKTRTERRKRHTAQLPTEPRAADTQPRAADTQPRADDTQPRDDDAYLVGAPPRSDEF
jgi:serine/threonine protein kinase